MKKRILTTWAMLACMIALPAVCGKGVQAGTIRMHKTAVVASGEIRLGEISDIEGAAGDLSRRLQNLVVAKAPLPGKTRLISDDQVRIKLRREGIDLSNLDFVSNDVVAVARSGIEISKKKIEQIAGEYVLAHIDRQGAEIRLKGVRVSRSVFLPQGRVTYKVLPPKNMHLGSSISLAVVFSVDGEVADRISTVVKIEVLKKVAVARTPLARKKVVQPGDIEMRMMDISTLPSGIITCEEDVVGMRPLRTININAVLRRGQFETPPLVKKGDIVLIIAESGGLRVTAHGEVKGKGRKGDTVRVVNLDSRKGVYARVVDEGTVKVAF